MSLTRGAGSPPPPETGRRACKGAPRAALLGPPPGAGLGDPQPRSSPAAAELPCTVGGFMERLGSAPRGAGKDRERTVGFASVRTRARCSSARWRAAGGRDPRCPALL